MSLELSEEIGNQALSVVHDVDHGAGDTEDAGEDSGISILREAALDATAEMVNGVRLTILGRVRIALTDFFLRRRKGTGPVQESDAQEVKQTVGQCLSERGTRIREAAVGIVKEGAGVSLDIQIGPIAQSFVEEVEQEWKASHLEAASS